MNFLFSFLTLTSFYGVILHVEKQRDKDTSMLLAFLTGRMNMCASVLIDFIDENE